MKGLVLSLKPFKQKNRDVIDREIVSYESPAAETNKPAVSGRGFFRDSSGNIIGRVPSAVDEEPPLNRYEFEDKGLPSKSSVSFKRHSGKASKYKNTARGAIVREGSVSSEFTENYEKTGAYSPYINTYDRDYEEAGANSRIRSKGMEISQAYSGSNFQGLSRAASDRDNIKKHIMSVVFALMLLLGVFCGTAVASGIDLDIISSLEFLMFTGTEADGVNGALEVFSSSFAVNFIYLTVVFLVGLSPWGIGVIPFVSLCKGFETGLTAYYLVNSFDWGMAYYFLVIAPGVFIFAFALIIQSGYSVRVSAALGRFLFTTGQESGWIRENIKTYMYKSGSMMIIATLAAAANTIMWMVCSSVFEI